MSLAINTPSKQSFRGAEGILGISRYIENEPVEVAQRGISSKPAHMYILIIVWGTSGNN
jgi:hypothetical protein